MADPPGFNIPTPGLDHEEAEERAHHARTMIRSKDEIISDLRKKMHHQRKQLRSKDKRINFLMECLYFRFDLKNIKKDIELLHLIFAHSFLNCLKLMIYFM